MKLPKVLRLSMAIFIGSACLGLSQNGSGELLPDFHLLTRLDLIQSAIQFGPRSSLPIRALDVWAEGTLAAISAGHLVHLVEFQNPESPSIYTINLDAESESWDVKLSDGYLYIGLQRSADGSSMLIYDVRDFESPRLIGRFMSEQFAGVHNLFVVENVAFLATFGSEGTPSLGLRPTGGRLWLVDVTDPSKPEEIGALFDDSEDAFIPTVHDVTVIGSRAYLAAWQNGFYIVDFDGFDEPGKLVYSVVAHHRYEPLDERDGQSPHTHNVWPSTDGSLLWTSDEVTGEAVRVFDVSDLENINLVGQYSLGGAAIPHNVVVDGDLVYISYYAAGLRVLKLGDAGAPQEVASFDTSGGRPAMGIFSGAWGVYPLGDFVLVSDTLGGLSIFEKTFVSHEPSVP